VRPLGKKGVPIADGTPSEFRGLWVKRGGGQDRVLKGSLYQNGRTQTTMTRGPETGGPLVSQNPRGGLKEGEAGWGVRIANDRPTSGKGKREKFGMLRG